MKKRFENYFLKEKFRHLHMHYFPYMLEEWRGATLGLDFGDSDGPRRQYYTAQRLDLVKGLFHRPFTRQIVQHFFTSLSTATPYNLFLNFRYVAI